MKHLSARNTSSTIHNCNLFHNDLLKTRFEHAVIFSIKWIHGYNIYAVYAILSLLNPLTAVQKPVYFFKPFGNEIVLSQWNIYNFFSLWVFAKILRLWSSCEKNKHLLIYFKLFWQRINVLKTHSPFRGKTDRWVRCMRFGLYRMNFVTTFKKRFIFLKHLTLN